MAVGKAGACVRPKLSVTFDQDVFDRVNALASARGCSFSEALRQVCRYAMDAADSKKRSTA